MIGPTGVGKTEIARRLSNIAGAPFIKVEATKYTEVGYVGRDVESMIRDLTNVAVNDVKKEMSEEVDTLAKERAEEDLIDILLPPIVFPRRAPPERAQAAQEPAGDGAERKRGGPGLSADEKRRRSRERFREMLRRGRARRQDRRGRGEAGEDPGPRDVRRHRSRRDGHEPFERVSATSSRKKRSEKR